MKNYSGFHRAKCTFALLALLCLPNSAHAELQNVELGRPAPDYMVETRIYQVLTKVTGNGLTSQTLPGPSGWVQVIHEKLDEVALSMEGPNLTWGGRSEPENPRIMPIVAPRIAVRVGEEALLACDPNEPVQFMEKKGDGNFQMVPFNPGSPEENIGITLAITPAKDTTNLNLLDLSMRFRYGWVKAREAVPGVSLPVGRPIVGQSANEGTFRVRLGEWSCLRLPVESQGFVYLFIRVQDPKLEVPIMLPADSVPAGTGSTSSATDAALDKAPNAERRGPKIEIGGSMRIRLEYRTGRP